MHSVAHQLLVGAFLYSVRDPIHGGGVPLNTEDGYLGSSPQDTLSLDGTASVADPTSHSRNNCSYRKTVCQFTALAPHLCRGSILRGFSFSRISYHPQQGQGRALPPLHSSFVSLLRYQLPG